MAFADAHLVHTDEAALVESSICLVENGSTEPPETVRSRSSAGERLLHTQDVTGSIPVATTIPSRAYWISILAPYGFNPPTWSGGRKLSDARLIYIIQSGQLVKVGVTNDIKQRLKAFRAGAPRGLTLRCTREVPALFAMQIEKQIHTELSAYAVGREWFRTSSKEARLAAERVIKRGWQAFDVYREAHLADQARPYEVPKLEIPPLTDVERAERSGQLSGFIAVSIAMDNMKLRGREFIGLRTYLDARIRELAEDEP